MEAIAVMIGILDIIVVVPMDTLVNNAKQVRILFELFSNYHFSWFDVTLNFLLKIYIIFTLY
jgi:hypothetical protein